MANVPPGGICVGRCLGELLTRLRIRLLDTRRLRIAVLHDQHEWLASSNACAAGFAMVDRG
ncbi:hypothetical protein [Paraburkholderia ginsengiterrae]|uniref:hypothetical protein n=1 Tax=Paraburkholderia ginsengiterrae TaxID=1462993 RepID=UPI0010423768|nr:hypothetical protein [Paraburkholderia ginsengiterrae]